MTESGNYALAIQDLPRDDTSRPDPPIWAFDRADILETLPYFRTLRSDTYISYGIVQGYLVDDPGDRAYLDSEVLITTIGRAWVDTQGTINQDTDRKLNAWERTQQQGGSVVVLMTTSCPLLPVGNFEDDVRYVVLGE